MAGSSIGLIALLATLTSCQDDAKIASRNLSKAADNFEIVRRVIYMNNITGQYLFEMVGRCSITDKVLKLDVTCKEGPGQYKKHFFGKGDNTSYMVQQVGTTKVSVFHTRWTFKPQSIIPDIDFRGNLKELTTNSSELNEVE